PDMFRGTTSTSTIRALSDLAGQLNGAVVMGHSQSGVFPLAATLLNPAVMKGLVLVEPGSCLTTYTADEIKALATVPILAVFGEHRDNPTGLPTLPTWQARYEMCQALIGRIKSAGGQAEMLGPPDRGIRGNSPRIMPGKNNLQSADLILTWVEEPARRRNGAAKGPRTPIPTSPVRSSSSPARAAAWAKRR